MQREFAKIMVLIGILVLSLVVGGVYYFGKLQTPQITPVPSSTLNASLAPNASVETANWKTYTDQTFPYSIQYPQTWSLEIIKDALDVPTIYLKPINQPKNYYSTEIYVGGPAVYSTSGAICANTKCKQEGFIIVQIEKEQINTPFFRISDYTSSIVSPAYRVQFELPQKYGKTLPGWSSSTVPYITATYDTDEEKTELVKIISTFKFIQ